MHEYRSISPHNYSVISFRCLSSQPDPAQAEAQAKRLEVSQASNMMDIGTRKIFSEEHDILRQSVRRFFQEEIAPHHDQ